jgi:sortase A
MTEYGLSGQGRSAPARAGRALGLGAGFVRTSLWGWREAVRRAGAVVAPLVALTRSIHYAALGLEAWLRLPSRLFTVAPLRPAVGRFLGGMGNVLVGFGAACLLLGGAIRLSRQAQLVWAAESKPPPLFEASVWPTAVSPNANAVTVLKPPDRIVIPALGLDEEVRPVGWTRVFNGSDETNVWETANYAAGFHENSASPGLAGNTVISGHNNILGAVFEDLYQLSPGKKVHLVSGDRERTYVVEESFIVQESGVGEAARLENAKWIAPTQDERLTLVSCYPPWGNTHRAIVVARPVEDDPGLIEEVLPDE